MGVDKEEFKRVVLAELGAMASSGFVSRINSAIEAVRDDEQDNVHYKKVIVWIKMFISEEAAKRISARFKI